ncbi:MAG: membrane protein insertion efficiency factor YidD [Clostridiales bacterium]|nr:membrane protein insertion efficiency factor YidD [Clostridiales bacterium]MDD6389286.1 membrane protein insertion efficiency factor YidD [Bacillota bacterium]
MKRFLMYIILFYQKFLSPLLPGKCRFTPTCSVYFLQALEKYGFYRGTFLGIKRILKCHPFHEGGYDPLK